MKIKTLLILFFVLSLPTIALSTVSNDNVRIDTITDSKKECSNIPRDKIKAKLSPFEKFYTIDDNNSVYAFQKANLIRSDISSKTDINMHDGRFVAFTIKPAPLLDSLILNYPLTNEDYPKFVARCKYDDSELEFSCTQNILKAKHVVEGFVLTLKTNEKSTCPHGIELDIQYSIDVNHDAYKALMDKIKKTDIRFYPDGESNATIAKIVESLDDKNIFFTQYWNAFLNAWENTNWESN